MKFAVIIATRGHPERVAAVIGSARMLASGQHDLEFLIACDDDDKLTPFYQFHGKVNLSIAPRPLGPGACWNRCLALTDAEVVIALPDDGIIATPHWDVICAQHFASTDPRIGVLAWTESNSPNQATVLMCHRKWIEQAGFLDERFPFWFADTAIAETYSFTTGQPLVPNPALHFVCRPGHSNPRMRDMRLWWTLFAATRQDRLASAAKIREQLGWDEPPNLAAILQGWVDRDHAGLPLSEEIMRTLKHRAPVDTTYLRARANAGKYLRAGQTIGLCMIVKNEATIIERCLMSVMGEIDHWTIVDTGSTDGTQDVIRRVMAGIPGDLHEHAWVDFATNRSHALELARDKADYSLIMDADDVLVMPDGAIIPRLEADSVTVDIDYSPIRYARPQMVSNLLPWRYRGVVHEFLHADDAKTQAHMTGITIRVGSDGARRKDKDVFKRDVEAIQKALAGETDPLLLARYQFYLGMSYKDAGMPEEAIDAFQKRATLGHWEEEIYVGLLFSARYLVALDKPDDEVIAAFAAAHASFPHRAEALHDLSRFLRTKARYQEAYEGAKAALGVPMPAGALFMEAWIYEYGLLDELAVSAYWSGHYNEAAEACERLLAENKMPMEMRTRVLENLRFSREKSGVKLVA